MSEIRLQLDESALIAATQQALVGILTPEAKEAILNEAVYKILTQSSGYGGRSQLQNAFDSAVCVQVNKMAAEMVGSNEILKERLNDLLRKTADKVFDKDLDKMAEATATAFIAALSKRDY